MSFSARVLAIALTLSATWAALPAAAAPQSALVAGGETQSELLEPRWLPWLGCWELTADAIDSRQIEETGRRVVCMAPRLDGLGVNLTTHVDNQVIAQNTVIADGREQILPEPDCRGTQTASWSADGHRLYSATNAACSNEIERSLVGLSLLIEDGRWVELQSVSIDGGEHRELLVRLYERIADAETLALGFTPLDPILAARAATARAAASAPLDVDDVLEASDRAPVEIVEAAILESNSLFPLDSSALIRLAEAGVEERVIDLMVAISFPDRFVVDSGESEGRGESGGGYGGYSGYGSGGYHGYYTAPCWGRYYGPFYGPYGPSCDSLYYSSPYFGAFRPLRGGSAIILPISPTGSLYGGKVLHNRGYASVTERPQGPTGGDTLRRAFRRNGGIGDTRSSPRSSGMRAVSPGGYRRSGSSGVGSSGSGSSSGSSGGARRAKAKPRGGSGG